MQDYNKEEAEIELKKINKQFAIRNNIILIQFIALIVLCYAAFV